MLVQDCELHTVLRLPRGTFTPYSQGVKANVVFFTKGSPTDRVWIYDARTNVPGITKKDRPLTADHFADFVKCYGVDPNGRAKRKASDSKEHRWRTFPISEVKERGFKLDGFKWLKEESLDDPDDQPEPEDLAAEAISELEQAVGDLNEVLSRRAGCLTGPSARTSRPPTTPMPAFAWFVWRTWQTSGLSRTSEPTSPQRSTNH